MGMALSYSVHLQRFFPMTTVISRERGHIQPQACKLTLAGDLLIQHLSFSVETQRVLGTGPH